MSNETVNIAAGILTPIIIATIAIIILPFLLEIDLLNILRNMINSQKKANLGWNPILNGL
ncbi:MAG: hypothetical protein ACTSRJ_07425 [Candidatus Hodarchaeales archaeon]